jgi:hypothetical protein
MLTSQARRTLFTSTRLTRTHLPIRHLATVTNMTSMSGINPKKEGDISSVFVSLSGAEATPLPSRFADIKRTLIAGHEDAVAASWERLLKKLAVENPKVKKLGPAIIPSVEFKDLDKGVNEELLRDIKKTGVVVVRGVVPEKEARGYKDEVEEYVRKNPSTRG